eukprot:TRINITY_DN8896_c0_g1_i4.p2 TRINITY_DN8896_c0_g1~~TRINITY_DN8896_c0_g1_i4.p2  ORF type:complete len:112 (+),score=10.43 TRINITY_DN8896_c0_g1_i4:136-471(+)
MSDPWTPMPLVLLIFPPVALFLGCLSLYQFSQIYIILSRLAQKPASGVVWSYLRPYLRIVVRHLNTMLGDADKLLSKVQPIHVILCAIMIVFIVSFERLIAQVSRTQIRTH